jgi:type IV secretion system protein TrbL
MGAAASTGYRLGRETSGESSMAAGLGGIASAGGAAARAKLGEATGLSVAKERGERAALFAGATSTRGPAAAGADSSGAAPDWARKLRSEQSARHHRQAALQAVHEGDRGGAAANPDIKEKEE